MAETAEGELARRALTALTDLWKEKIIEVSITGGVLSVNSNIPEGVKLIVRDYDVDGCCDTDVDKNGDACMTSEYYNSSEASNDAVP